MKHLTYAIVAVIAVFLCIAAWSQMDFTRIKIKTIHVAGNIYMLDGAGGNIGVSVGPDGILLIDDQFAPLAEKIRNALKELSDEPLKFLINTHFHGDHTGGNAVFGAGGAYYLSHECPKTATEWNLLPKKPCRLLHSTIRCLSTSTVKRSALSTFRIAIRMGTASFSSLDRTLCIWGISFSPVDFPMLI